MRDVIDLRGDLKIYLGDHLVREVHNTVVTAGKNYIASLFQSGGAFSGNWMALGIGTNGPVVGDTGLQMPKGTRAQGGLTVIGNVLSIESVFVSGNPSTNEDITEAGLFTASSGGTLFARSVFPPTPKPITDSLRIIWSVTVG